MLVGLLLTLLLSLLKLIERSSYEQKCCRFFKKNQNKVLDSCKMSHYDFVTVIFLLWTHINMFIHLDYIIMYMQALRLPQG